MFSASVNKPCNSSTVVDHGMFPTKRRLDCGCSVDMCCSFCACFSSLFSKKKSETGDSIGGSKRKSCLLFTFRVFGRFCKP